MTEVFSPYWFALYLVLGLLLAQIAVRNCQWAWLCALALPYVHSLGLSLGIYVVLVVIALPMLWAIARLPLLSARVGIAALLVPFLTQTVVVMGSLFIFALGDLLGAIN